MNIKLTLEDFNHICNYKPGTCDCDICTKYWRQVSKWLKEFGDKE